MHRRRSYSRPCILILLGEWHERLQRNQQMKQHTIGNSHHEGWNTVTAAICGLLLFGCLSFFYTVFAEAYIKHNNGSPLRPYGSTAMVSTVVCAFLGASAGTIVERLVNGNYSFVFMVCVLTNTLVALWYCAAWQQWNNAQWDSSSYIVFPSVFFAIVANAVLLAVQLVRIFASNRKRNLG